MILKHAIPFAFAASVLLAGCASKSVLRGPITDAPPVRSASFRQAMGSVIGTPFVPGNRITTLINGSQIFPAMLSAIHSAKKTVTFETFVFEKGEVPQRFAEALAERARAGVKVHVILDAHGASKSRAYNSLFKSAGVQVERYHHIFYPDVRRYNNRTHRKLLVIDQKAVRRASRKRWSKLLDAGIEIYEFEPTMIHSKLLIADGLFVSIGSANFDNRSLLLNDEANFDVLDAGFAAQQARLFVQDRARSEKATAEKVKGKVAEKPAQAVQTPVESQL